MKKGLYLRLAWMGIQKNRRIYLPYIIAAIGMVMMYYIISFLSIDSYVASIAGGDMMQTMLSMGTMIMSIFSLIFLFYTNSFLMRRRKKEFGLYHMLGMDKKNISRIFLWETLLIILMTLGGGVLFGILFSKVGELLMVNILEGEAAFSFLIESKAVLDTVKLFLGIFLAVLLWGLWQLCFLRPIELMHSEAAGEKPPKANWVLGILGFAILAGAYYIALSIQEPLAALIWFFVAVGMVILATYLLFEAGSVVLCRILQKNKRYYYKTNHFISVSSMLYRMKRNGAGLASICILSTMVLVMVSSVCCLYFGAEDNLRNRYPRNLVVDTWSIEKEEAEKVQSIINQVLEEQKEEAKAVLQYEFLNTSGYAEEGNITLDMTGISNLDPNVYGGIRNIFLISLADYNRLMGEEKTLEPGEVLVYSTKSTYQKDSITIEGMETWKIKENLTDFIDNGLDAMDAVSGTYIFLPEREDLKRVYQLYPEKSFFYFHTYFGVDFDCPDEKQVQIADEIERLCEQDETLPNVTIECAAKERAGFYAMYGGLFFLGILLGIVFILGMVLIMYYKQVTEGYEDQRRFEILQKVGMTKREIKKSINSQVLTVFFLPLLASGIHTSFAFPIIKQILVIFSVTNTNLLLGIMLGSFGMFALFYIVMYLVTSKAYYHIVSTTER